MITLSALGSFALIVGLLTLTPGLDTALILRTAALGHRSRAWGVVLGIQTGTLVWGVLSSLGITALLTASHLAYTILRWVGAAYLVWMGGRMLIPALRRSGSAAESAAAEDAEDADDTEDASDAGGGFRAGWRRGVVTNLLNPKMGAFYVAVLPQFIPAGAPHVATGTLLAGVHIVFASLWAAVLIAFARALRTTLRKPSARRVLDRVTGTVIAAFGVRLALGD
ncbi:lysine transporter LysE [Streptosporangium nondiastaticum]|uniref:Lysine transporter LysE n=1 Tax=Streptosporangium nondiastaticum TaxID=35764 RepID=A0A9X7JPK4_9ACTN|nr:LysE family translocator [Streptosporangium nondiastaticum]PSJ27373.1 lysine transporter LysE [Streptosporangium nondiastaticum]